MPERTIRELELALEDREVEVVAANTEVRRLREEVDRLTADLAASEEKYLAVTQADSERIAELTEENARLANLFLLIPEGSKLLSDFVASQTQPIDE